MANKKRNLGKKLAIGAGVVAAGTAAYMLLGPNGKKNRAKVKKVVAKAKSKGKAVMNAAMKKTANAEKVIKGAIKKANAVKKAVGKKVSAAKKTAKKIIKR